MKFERYLETKRFIDAIASLRVTHHRPSAHALEYLERERIVVPRLRLRYPDAIERRWLNHESYGWAIYRDWATEWREDAERLLKGFASPNAILSADFNETEVNAFLDLVEERDLLDFYWRWKSLNERAFSGDLNRMAGLRSDLQGMALSVEHLVDVMLEGIVKHPKRQMYDKFKQLWPRDTDVGKLLKSPEYVGRARAERIIDLMWHEKKQEADLAERIASDLAISHAIRGSAHYSLSENNQLFVEKMSVILLRGVMEAFRRSRSLDT